MKIIAIECNVDELKANRGIMDAIVEACAGMLGGFYGNYTPKTDGDEVEEDMEESEDI